MILKIYMAIATPAILDLYTVVFVITGMLIYPQITINNISRDPQGSRYCESGYGYIEFLCVISWSNQ